MTPEERAALLALAEPDRLTELADACLAGGGRPRVLVGPEVGCVVAQVREPIMRERFLLGDVLACRAEVELDGVRGWAMRLGGDREAVLAAAILDAEVAAGRPGAARVLALCHETAARQQEQANAEWAELAPTIVEFEEL